jgi:hypothetical protein
MRKFASGLALAMAMCLPGSLLPALADGMGYQRHYHHNHRIHLPPARHVVEVVQPPWSGNFIINGTHFTGRNAACRRWAAGERIRLVAGDWHGQCVAATFYNLSRHSTCQTWCK